MNVTITPNILEGEIVPPPSKSQAHRLLIGALLAGNSRVDNLADSQDILATNSCMEAILSKPEGLPLLDCGESGSTLRFLIPVAIALCGGGKFTGRGRLMERPQEPYFEIFKEKGISYDLTDSVLTVEGKLTAGNYALRGDISSQFITGLLYALPLVDGDSTITLTTDLESRGYVDLTLEVLSQFGIAVSYDGERTFAVKGNQTYRPCNTFVEADWSQSGFWYAAGGVGNPVMVTGMNRQSAQGDRAIFEWGKLLRRGGEVTLDVSQCPDLVPPVAAWAALRNGTTHLVNGARLRIKESDRLAAVTDVLGAMGADITEGEDSLTIHGNFRGLAGGVTVSSHNDHRIAMMAAIAASRCAAPVTIEGAQCVAKSYPDFWEVYEEMGGMIVREEG